MSERVPCPECGFLNYSQDGRAVFDADINAEHVADLRRRIPLPGEIGVSPVTRQIYRMPTDPLTQLLRRLYSDKTGGWNVNDADALLAAADLLDTIGEEADIADK